MVAAFLVMIFLTPLPWWAAVVVPLIGLSFGLFWTLGTAREFTTVRLRKHGFSPDVEPPRR
jgi:glucose uptake protein GlcU